MTRLKKEAVRQGRRISEIVATALRSLFRSSRQRPVLKSLPKFRSGGAFVDVSDRDALGQAMEGRQGTRG
jgi:hypothetical protein